MSRITRRSELRETVFLILFSADYHEYDEMPGQIKDFLADEDEFTEEEKQYIAKKVLSVCEKKDYIDSKLNEISIGWKVKRMTQADRTALRLAYYEINYDDTVPVPTAINEAVELAKNYGTDNSGSFVNGILAKVAENADK